jgi:hypothetical protein
MVPLPFTTGMNAQLRVYRAGWMVECWGFVNLTIQWRHGFGNFAPGATSGVPQYMSAVYFTCQNAHQIQSKYFHVI